MPTEIVRDRLIAAKKPWAVAAMLGLLTAALVNFAGMFLAWQSYAPGKYTQAFAAADQAKTRSGATVSALEAVKQKQGEAASWQQYLIQARERRFQSLDLMRAVRTLLPRDANGNVPASIADRREIHVDNFDMEFFPDLAPWFAGVQGNWAETLAAAEKERPDGAAAAEGDQAQAADPAATPVDPAAPPADGSAAAAAGPTGPGWVVQITGHHFHNEEQGNEGEQFVRSTIIRSLLGEDAEVPVAAGPQAGELVPVGKLGIGYPVLVLSSPLRKVQVQTSAAGPGAAAGFERGPGGVGDPAAGLVEIKRYDFILQFTWQPTTPGSTLPPVAPPAGGDALPQ